MSACHLKDIVATLAAVLSPLIGIAVAYVAYQQWKTNQGRERRETRAAKIAVYRRVKLAIGRNAQAGPGSIASAIDNIG